MKLVNIWIVLLSSCFFQIGGSDCVWAQTTRVSNLPVGSLLMLGIEETVPTKELIAHLKEIRPGAIILFRRNIQSPAQLGHLLKILQQELNPYMDSPLLFAIDQEGGSVYRLPLSPRIPSPAALGKSRDPQLVERYGYVIGKILRANGIAMNLAPVLDVDVHNQKNFIGSRSFGTDPTLVAHLGYLFAKGLASAGVIPTGKHFPGLGMIMKDPHQTTPTSLLEWSQAWNEEFLPFREFSRLSPSALMLSHVLYPKLDRTNRPASISPYIIKDILRNTFQYKGLVLTDDLLMKGITDQLSPVDAAVTSLQAGADMVMVSWSKRDQQKVFHGLMAALKANRLKEQDVFEKITQIRKIKSLLGLQVRTEVERIRWVSPELRALNRELMWKNLKLDNPSFKKIKPPAVIYLWHLGSEWRTALAKRFPQSKIQSITSVADFRKNSVNSKKAALLVVGISKENASESLTELAPFERAQTILIVKSLVPISQPESYQHIFAPLWNFDELSEAVAQSL